MICSVENCERPAAHRGLCQRHYRKLRAHGTPHYGKTQASPGEPLKFLKDAVAFQGDECLLWPYARNSAGYGHLLVNGQNKLAHRYVCEAIHGEPPFPRAEAAHSCGNGHLSCINGRHLSWKDRTGNCGDMIAHGRSMRGERMHMSVLTEQAVRLIWSRRDLRNQELAHHLGVSREVVYAVRRKRSWRWLTDQIDAENGVVWSDPTLVADPSETRRHAA